MDNKSAISADMNRRYTPRAKHINFRAFFVRCQVEIGDLKLQHVPFENHLAEYPNEAPPNPCVTHLREICGVIQSSR